LTHRCVTLLLTTSDSRTSRFGPIIARYSDKTISAVSFLATPSQIAAFACRTLTSICRNPSLPSIARRVKHASEAAGVSRPKAKARATSGGGISKVTGLSACTCQLSEVRVGGIAVMQLHSASRKAPPFNLDHLRGAACDAVFVLVLAKARLRRARAKRD
jgi:hypothetical protein